MTTHQITEKITVRELIRLAMTTAQILGQGESPSEAMAIDALRVVNELIDRFNTENLMVNSTRFIEFPALGKEVYKFGEGGDVTTEIPSLGIIELYYIKEKILYTLSPTTMDMLTVNNIPVNELKNIPNLYVFNNSYPLSELYVYPQPEDGYFKMLVKDTFYKFYNLDELVELPTGYLRVLRLNLASDLRIEYGLETNVDLNLRLQASKNDLKLINSANNVQYMNLPGELSGRNTGNGVVNWAAFYRGY